MWHLYLSVTCYDVPEMKPTLTIFYLAQTLFIAECPVTLVVTIFHEIIFLYSIFPHRCNIKKTRQKTAKNKVGLEVI